MSDFERHLRFQLVDAANDAPVFTGLSAARVAQAREAREGVADEGGPAAPARPASRRAPRVWLVAAAAVVVIAAGGLWWTNARGTPPPDAASCPSELRLGSEVYVGNGGLVRVPRPGPALQRPAVQAACGDPDAGPVTTYALPGVAASVGFFAGDSVWLNKSLGAVPPELRDLYASVTCTGSGERDLVGQLTGSTAKVTEDYHPKAPYTATFVADEGDGLGLGAEPGQYSSVTIEMRVTASTVAGVDPEFLRQALGNGKRARVTVTCDGSRFVADAFALQ